MKLFYAATSPYVRKVLVLAHEVGLADRIELVPVTVTPVTVNDSVTPMNPLAKVPTLVLDSGEGLYDSAIIVEYLDSVQTGVPLVPRAGMPRWTALRRQAEADGLLDAAILVRYEMVLRPAELRWPAWIDGQMGKIRRTLAALETETLGPGVTIGEIAIACALGYLDFRFPEEDWRARHPRLAQFQAGFAERASMRATAPPS
ncbi:MAG: glutathione S-transferase family protein [Aliidongia sp.]